MAIRSCLPQPVIRILEAFTVASTLNPGDLDQVECSDSIWLARKLAAGQPRQKKSTTTTKKKHLNSSKPGVKQSKEERRSEEERSARTGLV